MQLHKNKYINIGVTEPFKLFGLDISIIIFSIFVLLLFFTPPEQFLSITSILMGIVTSIISPLSGLLFIIFNIPLYLSETSRQWQFVFPVMLWLWVIISNVNFLLSKKENGTNKVILWPLLLILATQLISLPLHAKEKLLTISVMPYKTIFTQLLYPDHIYPTYPLSTILDTLLLISIYYTASNLFIKIQKINFRYFYTVVSSYFAVVAIVSITHYAFFQDPATTWYSLCLDGAHEGCISGFASNRTYFSSCLLLSLPIVLPLIPNDKCASRLSQIIGIISTIIILLALSLNGQRSVLLSIVILCITFSLLISKKIGLKQFLIAVTPVLVIVVSDFLFLNSFLLGKVVNFSWNNSEYVGIWRQAGAIVPIAPFLGIGTGSFGEWNIWSKTQIGDHRWIPAGNAHGQLLQALIEQGILGIAVWILLIFIFYRYLIKAWKENGNYQSMAAILGLTMWTTLSLNQTLTHVRPFILFLGIYLSILNISAINLAGLTLSRKWIIGMVICGVIAFSARFGTILSSTVPPGFSAGFYQEETFPGNKTGCWIAQKAVIVLSAADGLSHSDIVLDIACPLPNINTTPQSINIYANGKHITTVIIKDFSWHRYSIKRPTPNSPTTLLLSAKWSITPKAMSISNDQRDLSAIVNII